MRPRLCAVAGGSISPWRKSRVDGLHSLQVATAHSRWPGVLRMASARSGWRQRGDLTPGGLGAAQRGLPALGGPRRCGRLLRFGWLLRCVGAPTQQRVRQADKQDDRERSEHDDPVADGALSQAAQYIPEQRKRTGVRIGAMHVGSQDAIAHSPYGKRHSHRTNEQCDREHHQLTGHPGPACEQAADASQRFQQVELLQSRCRRAAGRTPARLRR